MLRRQTRAVRVKDITIGAGAAVSVQSMTKTPAGEVASTVRQIEELAELGCEIIRCAVPNRKAAAVVGQIVSDSPLPVIADTHFDPALAIDALKAGVAGIRVNPCTVSDKRSLRGVYRLAGERGVKVRIGINSGSVRRRKGLEVADQGAAGDVAELMVSEALRECAVAEESGCSAVVLSLKASSVSETVRAYRSAASRCDYPLHLGLTAAGPPRESMVKSAIGIGALLLDGIGDTIRVSMTGPPHEEVAAAYRILRALNLREPAGPEIISCPTCGRCDIDLQGIVAGVQERLGSCGAGIKVAIMGCVVNGPGEAAEADVGIAGGKNFGFLFKHGRKVRKVAAERLVEELVGEVKGMSGGD